MKSQKIALMQVGQETSKPAIVIDSGQLDAKYAHEIAQAVATIIGAPIAVYMPGRRSSSGLYVPKP